MSWQLAAFTILAIGLAGGFAWYERTKPDAKLVALVATLAAFAALGRIAFAALPNVKPTTDIVLVSGYALGGGPGFVVGALAGLTSNFFFGQGPWTPWQMAAWGVTGLIGAGFAVLTRHRIRRIPLAIVCTATGFAFTAIQDVGDWITYSDHSAAQLGIYVGKGLGFDTVHAVGCLVFALAFGPALTRSIQRFATRLTVTWTPSQPVVPVLAAIVLAGALLNPVINPTRAVAATPSSYLLKAQNPDGGFGPSPGAPSSQLFAGWAALGLAAQGYNAQRVSNGGPSLIDYIRSGVGSLTDPGSLERTILAVRAADLPATSFGGQDLLGALEREIKPDGSVEDQVNLTSFAVLALRAGGLQPSARTLSWLTRQQDSDGGFNFATAGAASDVDDTGAALEALAGGGSGRTISRAVAFIRGQQNSDGGFPSDPGGNSNAQSTAWAIQGLIAVGASGAAVDRALACLRSLTAADGHISYSQGADQTPVWVTAEAEMALAGKPLPLAPVPLPIATPAAESQHHRRAPRGQHTTSIGTSGTTTTTTSTGAPAPLSHRSSPRSTPPAPDAAGSFDGLAVDDAVATAVALAPLGLG
jgi:energy-coupling factor transport system substrate-specific component